MAKANNWHGAVLTLLEKILRSTRATTRAIEDSATGSSSWKLGNCSDCEHWNDAGDGTGECRRWPPSIRSIDGEGHVVTEYRFTESSDSCSEWRQLSSP